MSQEGIIVNNWNLRGFEEDSGIQKAPTAGRQYGKDGDTQDLVT